MDVRNRFSRKFDVKSELNRAISYHQNGQFHPAEQIYRSILEFHPRNAEVLHLMGLLAWQTNRCEVAVNLIRQASQIKPREMLFLRDLARFLNGTGCFDQAVQAYRQALEVDSEDLVICRELAFTLYQAGRCNEALQVFQHKLNDNSGDIKFRVELGDFLQSVGQFEASVRVYQKALSIDTNACEAYNNLGVALSKVGRFEQSIQACQDAIRINPDYFEAYYNQGVVLQDQGNFSQAIESYQEAIRINPDYAQAYNNYGFILHKQGKFDEAIKQYRRAIDLDSTIAQARTNLGVALLLVGDFKEGWREYDWRLKVESYWYGKRPLPYPRWHGGDLEDKTILVLAEQGIGDQIMFASVLHLLTQKSRKVLVEIDPRLIPTFQRSFPHMTFFPQFDLPDFSVFEHAIDYQIPIASLGQHFLNTEPAFPKQQSYLVPCSEKVRQFRSRYKQLADGKPLVGISWRGGNRKKESRDIPLGQWADLIAMGRFCFINLQYGNVTNEVLDFTTETGISVYSDDRVDSSKDLDGFVAQVAAMDLVVSVANSTAHFAGSLGKSALILLPLVPDWRWMISRADSLWYPEITLLRQSRVGDWGDVLQYTKIALTQFVLSEEVS